MNNQTFSTRSIGDSSVVFTINMISRTEKTAMIETDPGVVKRCKIYKCRDQKEYVMPYGQFSMAPIFYIN